MKTIKLIIALFLLTTFVGCSKDVQEEVKYEMLEYNTVEDLMDYLVDIDVPRFNNVNNVAYTIREDDLLDEYYNTAYEKSYNEYDISESELIWLAYYFADTKQYCETQDRVYMLGCHIDDVYVTTTSYYPLIAIIIQDANKMVEEDGKFIYSPIVVYPVGKTETLLQAIDNAYIISQGEGTPGYEEAMNWSYEVAVSNGGPTSKENFIEDYTEVLSKYEPQLREMQGKDIDWLVEHYDEYSKVFREIDDTLKIIE